MLRRFIPLILISVLFVGCGKTAAEDPVEQAAEAVSEESETAEPETEEPETEEPGSETVGEPEKVSLCFDFNYDIKSLVPESIEGEVHTEDFNLYTGNLLNTDGSFPETGNPHISRPCYEDNNEHLKYYPLSKEHGEAIRKLYIDLYNDELAEQQDAINDLYVTLANEEAELGPSNVQDRDITSQLPETLHLKYDGQDVAAKVDKCKVTTSTGVAEKEVPDGIAIEYWTRDDEVHYLTGIRVTFQLILDNSASIEDYFISMIEEDKEGDYSDYEASFDDVIDIESPVAEAEAFNGGVEIDIGSGSEEDESDAVYDLTGTWYDPTGLSTGGFIFNGDGNGTFVWDYSGNSAPPDSMTYSVDGNVITMHLPSTSFQVRILNSSTLTDGESNYIRR